MKKAICIIVVALMLMTLLPCEIFAEGQSGLKTLYCINTAYCGYYDDNSEPFYHIGYSSTGLIDAVAGDYFTFAPVYSKQDIYVTCFDSNEKVIKKATRLADLFGKGTLNDGAIVAKFVVPEGTSYVRVTCRAEDYNTFLVTKNQAFDADDYYTWIGENGLETYRAFAELDKSSFKNKKIVFCGDSVGAGAFETDYPGANNGGYNSRSPMLPAFAGRVADILGISDWTNLSASGATFSNKMYGNNISSQATRAAMSGADIIVIEGGVVDTGGYAEILVPIGYISDEYTQKSFAPENTLMGGMERTFFAATKYAKKDAIIICVMPYRVACNKTFVGQWYRNYQYYAAVCEKWGVYLVDLYNNEGVNKVIDSDPSVAGLFYADNAHTTAVGYMTCSLEIAMQMIDFTKKSKQNRHMPENLPYNITEETWEDPDPGDTPVKIKFAENKFTWGNKSMGRLDASQSDYEKSELFMTSNYIEVTPGDVVYFGPVSPYEECQLTTFDASKNVVTGRVTSLDTDGLCGTTSTGRIILQYTVPEGVNYIRVVFHNTVSPIITINRPFDGVYYREALAAALAGEKVEAPAIGEPTADLYAYHATYTKPAETDEETEAETEGETGELSGGCNSGIYSLAFALPLTFAICKKKRKKEQ